MSPRIFLIRHAQALHNVVQNGKEDHTIPDPPLTELGEKQAAAIPGLYPVLLATLDPKNTIIACSPFTRTLQTALIGFKSVLPPTPPSSCIPFILLPQLQECGAEPCDTGCSLEEKKAFFSGEKEWLDWSECTEGWNSNEGFYAATDEAQTERGKWVREWIKSRTEENIVIMSHHGFLRRITRTPQGQSHWPNAEAREYRFKDPSGKDPLSEVELVPEAVL